MDPKERLNLETSPNFLLRAFAEEDRRRWQARLEPVSLAAGAVLCKQGGRPAHLVFPGAAVVSLQAETPSGASAEIAVIGREGVIGTSLLGGHGGEPGRSVVLTAGEALRVHSRDLRDELRPSGAVLDVLLTYQQSLLAQVAQTVLCHCYHSIERQFCRRLLMALDRSDSTDLLMTHEHTAGLLGVRREGVSVAAMKLQRAGLIRYSRGRITVRDRRRLEARACECYALAKQEYARLK